MREIKCFCDVCGMEVNADDLIIFKANDFFGKHILKEKYKKFEICNDCLSEIGEKIRNKKKKGKSNV